MSGKLKNFNWNYVAAGILLVAYLFSVVRFLYISVTNQETDEGTGGIVRVTHWQLEPGFREAMDWAIAKYNAQPKVIEAGITIEQAAITERVFTQFMNVHLISGTAPDIAAKGHSNIIKGNALARFYTPLGEYVNQPNPYNTYESMGKDRPEKLRKFLHEAPWRETFIDGMLGGYVGELNDFYAIPLSNYGGLRIFYNADLTGKIKRYALGELKARPDAEWIQRCVLRTENGEEVGYLPIDDQLKDWLADGEVTPQTLGQLFFFCEATLAYAEKNNLPNLVPISTSSYGGNNIAGIYERPFFRNVGLDVNMMPGSEVSFLEVMESYQQGKWDFYTPAIREYYRLSFELVRYFPIGYLGKDREQAQRRFVLGDAVMLSSGGWDASSVIRGVASRDNEEDHFEVKIAPAPLPDEDERWAEMIPMHKTEANFRAGVPLAVNLQSHHFEWALDFLKYMTSLKINEEFNRRAGWLPAIEGGEPIEYMEPFSPIREGISELDSFGFGGSEVRSSISSAVSSNAKLYFGGEIGYDEFVQRVDEVLKQPRLGIESQWRTTLQKNIDQSRAQDRSVSVSRFRMMFDGTQKELKGYLAKLTTSVESDEGRAIFRMWKKFNGEEPFPENE